MCKYEGMDGECVCEGMGGEVSRGKSRGCKCVCVLRRY